MACLSLFYMDGVIVNEYFLEFKKTLGLTLTWVIAVITVPVLGLKYRSTPCKNYALLFACKKV